MTAPQLSFSHFFNAPPGNTDVENRLNSLPDFPASCSRGAVLCGPERSGRSSLLLNVARNLASESPGSRVIFLCRRDKMEASSPVFQAGSGPRDPAFSAVHFKFVESCDDLLRFASCINLVVNEGPLAGILVDDLSELIVGASPQRLAVVLAFLTDATRQVGGRRNAETPARVHQSCPLIVTDLSTAEGGPSNLFVYRKWLPLALVIRSVAGSGFSLSAMAPSKEQRTLPPDLHHADLCFSISQSSLHLDAIRSCPPCTNESHAIQ